MAKKLMKAQMGKILKKTFKAGAIEKARNFVPETYGKSRWTTWEKALKERPDKVYPTLKPEVTKDGKPIFKTSQTSGKKASEVSSKPISKTMSQKTKNSVIGGGAAAAGAAAGYAAGSSKKKKGGAVKSKKK